MTYAGKRLECSADTNPAASLPTRSPAIGIREESTASVTTHVYASRYNQVTITVGVVIAAVGVLGAARARVAPSEVMARFGVAAFVVPVCAVIVDAAIADVTVAGYVPCVGEAGEGRHSYKRG
ncbi:hypothetical protein MHUMG1_09110 [Metarhizium humberi]|uniref:Uncharacterized protein n=1 Tax=Metarhizium humberi TaxID=2596975 RepID=A0A9P8M3I5_9HYPO|nr:hypothetical protein MHUMG1_09110 [Metarhizium humberi]